MAVLYSLFVGFILLSSVDIIAGRPEQGVQRLRLFTVCLCLLMSNECYV